MEKLRQALVGIDRGTQNLFSDFEDEGPMWRGIGAREVRHRIRFSEPFLRPPIVHPSLEMWDFDRQTNLRADIRAENVTEDGFDLVFRTWEDTRVARARASWLAIGEVLGAEDWAVDGGLNSD